MYQWLAYIFGSLSQFCYTIKQPTQKDYNLLQL